MKKGGLFQFHLSTIVLLMLVGGAMLGLNITREPTVVHQDQSLIPTELRTPFLYTATVPGFPYSSEYSFRTLELGFRGHDRVLESDRYKEEQRHVVITNVVINLTALLLLAFFIERVILPRSKLKDE